MAPNLYACNFEIFGKVQGVYFRKYTRLEALKLGLGGWCMNTASGTVQGHLEGVENKISEMKKWLTTKGSPSSKIENATFSVLHPITTQSKTFTIRK